MINAASGGDVQALSMLGTMAQQMSQTPGSMQQFAVMLKPLIDGERDLGKLTKNMDEHARQLMEGLLSELSSLESSKSE